MILKMANDTQLDLVIQTHSLTRLINEKNASWGKKPNQLLYQI